MSVAIAKAIAKAIANLRSSIPGPDEPIGASNPRKPPRPGKMRITPSTMDRNHGAPEPSTIGKTPALWPGRGRETAGSRHLNRADGGASGVCDKVHCDMAGIVV
jgi:hypothetical protein